MQENILGLKSFGIVKWFDYKKGYGFVTPEKKENDKDVFVHVTALQDANIGELKEGQVVEYYTYKDRKRIAGYITRILS